MADPDYFTASNILNALAALGGGAATGYATAYYQKRGELKAIKDRLEDLKDQERELTTIKETVKLITATQGEVGKELRDAVRELAISMSKALYAMCRLTWSASLDKQISEDTIKWYDNETYNVIAIMLGQVSVIAAIDKETYEKLAKISLRILSLEAQVAHCFHEDKLSKQFDLDKSNCLFEESKKELFDLPNEIADIIEHTIPRLAERGGGRP